MATGSFCEPQGTMADGMVGDTAPSDPETTEEIAMELYTIVCKNGGIMEITNAPALLSESGRTYIKNDGFYPLISHSSFGGLLKLSVERPSNRATLQAITNVDLCSDYKECTTACCPSLHVCPSFIKGECNASCPYSHNFLNERDQRVLTENKLNRLDVESVVAFLRQTLFGSMASEYGRHVCPYYNTGTGCSAGKYCLKLHVCSWFEKGKCQDTTVCSKSHNLDGEKARVFLLKQKLHEHRSVGHVIENAMLIGAQYFMRALCHSVKGNTPTIDEICSYHLKGTCQYGKHCFRYKHNLPYLWQIQIAWTNGEMKWFPFSESHNKDIEQDYCDVSKETSIDVTISNGQNQTHLVVNFLDMLAKDSTGNCVAHIRRLSTCSWIKASPNDNYATRWTWYWSNDQSQWVPYNKAAQDTNQDILSNEKLEEGFLSGIETVKLSLNQYQYMIDFKNMLQTNQSTGKARPIRRRPSMFIKQQDLTNIATRSREQVRQLGSPARSVLPGSWTPMTEDQEVVTVALAPDSQDYLDAAAEFKKTLNGKTIRKIERIQNADLWESYHRKHSKLSRKLRQPVAERRLFHGTSETSVNAISQQGFDWRLCGVHGTAFGKGSYFARDASYSDGFAPVSSGQGEKMMFLAKVIVGSFVVGNSSTVRPPPVSPQRPHELHNACVNNLANPSIFVIFDNDQAYPELLITYK